MDPLLSYKSSNFVDFEINNLLFIKINNINNKILKVISIINIYIYNYIIKTKISDNINTHLYFYNINYL